ncbi:MAG: ABC transporter permease [Dongiaceae bacterium]
MAIQLWALLTKEFLLLLRGRRGLLALIVPPVLQLMLFGYAATFDVTAAPIAILNEDLGSRGRELAARFAASPLFRLAALPTTEAELRRLVDEGEAVLALRIGQRFSAELGQGTASDLQIIIDGRPLNTALLVQNYAQSIVAGFNRDHIALNGLPRPLAATVMRAWYNPNLLSHWYVIPGLVAKILLIVTLTSATLAIVAERELGTLERLGASAVSPLLLLLGKTIPALAVGFGQGMLMAALTAWWFGVPFRGSLPLLALSLIVMLLAAIGIGLLISAATRSQAKAIVVMVLCMVPAIMLSGFATPIASMPDAIKMLTAINPLRWFIAIMRGLYLRSSGWDQVWPLLQPILAIAALSLAGTWLLLARRHPWGRPDSGMK